MQQATLLFAAAVLVAGALATIAIWAPRRFIVRAAALAAAAAFMPLAYAAMTELLSRPKPVSFEWAQRAAKEGRLLGAKTVEDEAIYLFLDLPGLREPRAYVLPWRRELAEELQGAQKQAEEQGGGVVVDQPFDQRRYEPSLEDRPPMFYPEPPPALPEKAVPEAPALYQRDDGRHRDRGRG